MGINLERAAVSWETPQVEEFQTCVKPGTSQTPELDANRLRLDFLYGTERDELHILTGGEASLLLRYKRKNTYREGYEVSLQDLPADQLDIVQFKGAKQEGFRITQGFNVAKFMADQTVNIAEHPESTIRWITMKDPLKLTENITNIASCDETLGIPNVIERYKTLADYLGMKWSEEEKMFIREVNNQTQTPGVVFQAP